MYRSTLSSRPAAVPHVLRLDGGLHPIGCPGPGGEPRKLSPRRLARRGNPEDSSRGWNGEVDALAGDHVRWNEPEPKLARIIETENNQATRIGQEQTGSNRTERMERTRIGQI